MYLYHYLRKLGLILIFFYTFCVEYVPIFSHQLLISAHRSIPIFLLELESTGCSLAGRPHNLTHIAVHFRSRSRRALSDGGRRLLGIYNQKKMDMLALRLSFYLVVCMLEVLHGSDDCSLGECAIMITPSNIVVPYGSPFSVNCSSCVNGTYKEMKWETPLGSIEKLIDSDNGINKTIARWNVDNATEWAMRPMCYASGDPDCVANLAVTLYKPPENVDIFLIHTGPLLEGRQYTLLCRVRDVAPVQNLTVTFYRGDAMLGPVQSSRTSVETPVTETFSYSITSSREDDGVQYWCEAKLNLGPQGPPPVRRSERLTTTMYFKPKMVIGSSPDPISITKGHSLRLNCTAHSNPSPAYSWTGPDNTTVGNGSVFSVQSAGFEHEGLYVCVASNNQGSTTKTFNVDVSVNWLPIIAVVATLLFFIVVMVVVSVYNSHYKKTRTGQYKLKDVFRRNRGNPGLLGVA